MDANVLEGGPSGGIDVLENSRSQQLLQTGVLEAVGCLGRNQIIQMLEKVRPGLAGVAGLIPFEKALLEFQVGPRLDERPVLEGAVSHAGQCAEAAGNGGAEAHLKRGSFEDVEEGIPSLVVLLIDSIADDRAGSGQDASLGRVD